MRIAVLGSGSSAAAAALALEDLQERGFTAIESLDILDFGGHDMGETPRSHTDYRELKTSDRMRTAMAIPEIFNVDASGSAGLGGSAAWGGWSNVWGATRMRLSDEGLVLFGDRASALESAYSLLDASIPGVGKDRDNSGRILPSFVKRTPNRPEWLLQPSELAVSPLAQNQEQGCNQCGQCLKGCPSDHVWSARTVWNKLLARPLISYHSGLWVDTIREADQAVYVKVKDSSGLTHEMRFDKVFVALGALQSGALMLRSRIARSPVVVRESPMTIVPFVDRFLRPLAPSQHRIALSEGFLAAQAPHDGKDFFAQVYGYSPSLDEHLVERWPKVALVHRSMRTAMGRHLGVAMCFFDDTLGGRIVLTTLKGRVSLTSTRPTRASAGVCARLTSAGLRSVGLQPIWLARHETPVGFGYHLGASFPMSRHTVGNVTDPVGRPPGAVNLHLIDSSALPRITARPVTWTAMANAVRIVREVLTGNPVQ